VEIAAPRLDDAEVVEMVEREQHRAVAAGGKPDERPSPSGRDRPQVPVDVRGKLAGERGLPVAARAPVEVLGIAVFVPRALRGDEDDRAAERVERTRQPADVPVFARSRGQAVEEVDDGIVAAVRSVPRRQVGDEVKPSAHRLRRERESADGAAHRRRVPCMELATADTEEHCEHGDGRGCQAVTAHHARIGGSQPLNGHATGR
jgi:hypothetical protein